MKSPFKFLDSFTKEDKDIFFGRDAETEELYQKIFESKLLLVYGVSGTGKSSLIQCGLANKFQESDWFPINIRRGANINDSIYKTIEKQNTEEQEEGKKKPSLKKLLRNLYLDNFKPIYLIFDQFEELFIFGSKSEREDFVKSIKKLKESDLQIKMLFVIREEYLASITEFEREIPEFLQNRIRIEKMNRSNATQAIEGPCKVANIKVEEGFSDEILNKLTSNTSEIELTYLQVFLDKIFRESAKRTDDGAQIKLSKQVLNDLGNVTDLLGSFLEEQIAELEKPEEGLTILKAFVSTKGTKRQITQEEVLDYSRTLGKDIPLDSLKSLLQKFVALRILRDKDEAGRYELRHDALAAKIFEKISLSEKALLEVRQFVENAYENYKKRDILLSRVDLEYIEPFESSLVLNDDLQSFLTKSQAYLKKQKRVMKQIMAASILIFVLLIGVIIIYASRLVVESEAKDRAVSTIIGNNSIPYNLSNALTAYKKNKESTECQRALLESYFEFMDTDIETFKSQNKRFKFLNDSIAEIIHNQSSVIFEKSPSNIITMKFSQDSSLIYALLDSNEVCVWNLEGEILHRINISNSHSVLNYSLSPKNNILVYLDKDSLVNFMSVEGELLYSIKSTYVKENPSRTFAFMDNDRIAVIEPKSNLGIFNINDGSLIQRINTEASFATSVATSWDNKFIAMAIDSNINIWYYDTINSKYRDYNIISDHSDTIWSVEFARSDYYILFANNNKKVLTNNINGNYFRRIYPIIYNHNPKPCYDASFLSEDIYVKIRKSSYNQSTNDFCIIRPLDRYAHNNFINNGSFFNVSSVSSNQLLITMNGVSYFYQIEFGNQYYKRNPYYYYKINSGIVVYNKNNKRLYYLLDNNIYTRILDFDFIVSQIIKMEN